MINFKLIKFLLKYESKTLLKDIALLLSVAIFLIPLYFWEKEMYFIVTGIFCVLYPSLSAEYPGHLVPHDFSWKYYHMIISDRASLLLSSVISTLVKGAVISCVVLPYLIYKFENDNNAYFFILMYLFFVVAIRLIILFLNLAKMKKVFSHRPINARTLDKLAPYLTQLHQITFYFSFFIATLYGVIYAFSQYGVAVGKSVALAATFSVGVYFFVRILRIWDDEKRIMLHHLKVLPQTVAALSLAIFFSFKLGYLQHLGHDTDAQLVKKGNIELLKTRDFSLKIAECTHIPSPHLIRKAVWENQTETAIYLVERASSEDPSCDYKSLTLRLASASNRFSLIEELHRRGALLELADKNGNTPLFYAADAIDITSMLLLEKMGANKDHKNNKGETYLEFLKRIDPNKYKKIEFFRNL